MSRNRTLRAMLALSVPVAFASAPAIAAQDPIEEIVVTGSFIRGTPQDAALPVDIIGQQDLVDQGSPTITEMIRNLHISNGNIGETNQFNASGGQSNEGAATVNLRGLGSERTLVLINGRRHVASSSIGVDISAIPSIAIGRLETLKDGAAALYGSDAIAGVANFITRNDFEGLELRASGQTYEETDGEYQIGAIGGWSNDRLSGMVALEYERRSEVRLRDIDWATRPYESNIQGGWSAIGQPGTLFPVTPAGLGAPVPDPVCDELGNQNAAGLCRFQFTNFDNLVEEQDTYKSFAEVNYELTDTVNLHVEGMYSFVDVPEWATSPSYPPQALFGPDRITPVTHPGLADFINKYPNALPADTVAVFPFARHAGAGGFGGEPRRGFRETDTYRLAGALDGTLFDGGLGFDIALSWSRRDRTLSTPDMAVERMAFALDGLGGPDCDRSDPANLTPGQNGCLFHTPFSNAIDVSAVNGAVNPDADPDLVAQNLALQPWFEDQVGSESTFELLVFDATFDGELPIELPGGTVGYAVGIQSRNEKYELEPFANTDLTQNPCPFSNPTSVALGNTDTLDCTQSNLTSNTGPYAFLSGTFPQDTERTIYGGFFELGLPVTERLNAQFAMRFEDYGNLVGSTVDPKLAVRFQATDELVLRGSVSTTFRGPPQNFLQGRGTSLQFVGPTNAFKAIDTVGNASLSNEEAVASNFGIVFDSGNFFGSLDYWRFDFTDPIQVESFNGVVKRFAANGCSAGGAGVGTDTCNALADKITFQAGADQTPANISRLDVSYTNGGDITTSGVDWFAQYDMDTDFGLFTVGTQGTYTHEYDVDDFTTTGGVFLAPGGDFAGKFNNDRNTLTPILDLQGNVFAKYTRGIHRATLTGRYWGEYEDDSASSPGNDLSDIGDMFTVDLNYNVSLMDDALGVNLSVFNMFDIRPPRVQNDLNYDPYTHSPYGRMIKLGLTYTL